jgi:hypothetical protein
MFTRGGVPSGVRPAVIGAPKPLVEAEVRTPEVRRPLGAPSEPPREATAAKFAAPSVLARDQLFLAWGAPPSSSSVTTRRAGELQRLTRRYESTHDQALEAFAFDDVCLPSWVESLASVLVRQR